MHTKELTSLLFLERKQKQAISYLMGSENTTIKEGLLEFQFSHLKTVSQSEFSHLKKMIPADIYLKVQL